MVERGMKLMNASPDSYITCYFRVITKTGEVKQAKAQARFRSHPTYGDLFFVMLMETSADDGCMTCGEPPVS